MANNCPYASSFKSAINRGTPCSTVVCNIAKRCKKTPNQVFNSLWKSGHCCRQKFNGQWVYWPSWSCKKNATNAKACQVDLWQCFVDWCCVNGCCTPEQLKKNCGSQSGFMKYCRKFFGKQFPSTSSSTGSSTGSKRSRTTTRSKKSTPRSYKFPSTRSGSRRTSRAA